MSYVAARRSPDDLIYVYWRAVPAVTYYAPSYGMAGSDFIAGSEGGTSADPFRTDIDQLAARGRAWFVFNDRGSNCRLDERYYLSRLGRLGVRLDKIRSDGAAAFLYEFSGVRQPSN